MYKAVIFDLDDTLVNTTEVSKMVVKKVYSDNIDYFNGKTVDEVYNIASKVFSRLTCDKNIPTPSATILVWFGIFEELGITPPPLRRIVELRQKVIKAFSQNVKKIKGVDEVLSCLRNKEIKIGVLTNGPFLEQAQKAIVAGIDRKIDYLVGTDMCVADKPDPKAFNFILKKLAVNSSEAIMVGDSLEADVLGAQNVGMKGVLYRSGWRDYTKQEKAKADFIIDDLSELYRLFW